MKCHIAFDHKPPDNTLSNVELFIWLNATYLNVLKADCQPNKLCSEFALAALHTAVTALPHFLFSACFCTHHKFIVPILHCMCLCTVFLFCITNRHRARANLQNCCFFSINSWTIRSPNWQQSVLSVNLWIPAGSAVAHASFQAGAGFRQEIRQWEVL